jgi:hypothetical protein
MLGNENLTKQLAAVTQKWTKQLAAAVNEKVIPVANVTGADEDQSNAKVAKEATKGNF